MDPLGGGWIPDRSPLDAAFGRRCIGANHIDIEVAHRAAELREAVAGLGALGIDASNQWC